jgi:hypothetical protein
LPNVPRQQGRTVRNAACQHLACVVAARAGRLGRRLGVCEAARAGPMHPACSDANAPPCGRRDFVLASYADIKKANPTLPILVREAEGAEAKLIARYGEGAATWWQGRRAAPGRQCKQAA